MAPLIVLLGCLLGSISVGLDSDHRSAILSVDSDYSKLMMNVSYDGRNGTKSALSFGRSSDDPCQAMIKSSFNFGRWFILLLIYVILGVSAIFIWNSDSVSRLLRLVFLLLCVLVAGIITILFLKQYIFLTIYQAVMMPFACLNFSKP